jgi:hypothetical protein
VDFSNFSDYENIKVALVVYLQYFQQTRFEKIKPSFAERIINLHFNLPKIAVEVIFFYKNVQTPVPLNAFKIWQCLFITTFSSQEKPKISIKQKIGAWQVQKKKIHEHFSHPKGFKIQSDVFQKLLILKKHNKSIVVIFLIIFYDVTTLFKSKKTKTTHNPNHRPHNNIFSIRPDDNIIW